MFKDFFNREIKLGDWLHLSQRSGGTYMRFGLVEKIGTTGKVLLRVYISSNGVLWGAGKKLVPYADTSISWKISFGVLPQSLQDHLNRVSAK